MAASGATAAIGATIGAAIVGSAVSATTAMMIGSAVVGAGVTAASGGDASDVLQAAVLGGVTAGVGSGVASTVSNALVDAGVNSAIASTAAGAAAGATSAALRGGDIEQGLLMGGLNAGFNQALDATATAINTPSKDTGDLSFRLPEYSEAPAEGFDGSPLSIPDYLAGPPQDAAIISPDTPAPIAGDSSAASLEPVSTGLGTGSSDSASLPPLSGDWSMEPVDYSLGAEKSNIPTNEPGLNPAGSYTELTMDSIRGQAPGLASMGGGSGLSIASDTPLGDPASFINNLDYSAGMPSGTVSSAGFIDESAMPSLGSPGSFINNPKVTGEPVIPTPSCAYNVNVPNVRLSSLLGSEQGSQGSQALSGTGAGTLDSNIPWLDTRPQMLRNTPVTSRGGVQLGELRNLYQQMTPELSSVFADRGIGRVGAMPMAEGGLTDSSFKEITEKFRPKFYANTAPTHLQGAPVGRRQGMSLSPLRHLFGKISEYGNIGGMARGGLPTKYKEAAPDGHNPEFITGLTGFYASGRGTGQSDDIPAMLHDGDYVMDADTVAALGDGSSKAGAQALEQFRREVPHRMSEGGKAVPAKIADGEYVFPEAFVTALGNGDNKRGAKMLDAMRENLRAHKRSAPTSKIPPKALSPLDYLNKAKG